MAKSALLIGLRSDCVDYTKWPQLSAESLEAAFDQILNELTLAGYQASWCLTDNGQTAETQVRKALKTGRPDIVVIGAGVRTDADHFLLFERVVNAVHQDAPQARIAFNQLPFDTVDAVKRWS